MSDYFDSFDCQIQCEEFYNDFEFSDNEDKREEKVNIMGTKLEYDDIRGMLTHFISLYKESMQEVDNCDDSNVKHYEVGYAFAICHAIRTIADYAGMDTDWALGPNDFIAQFEQRL